MASIKLLAENGADIMQRDKHGNCPLLTAVMDQNDIGVIDFLIEDVEEVKRKFLESIDF